MSRTLAVVRTLLIGTVFLSIWTWFLPLGFARIEHTTLTPRNALAWIPVALGFAISFWCAMEFALRGRGTPAPFDPPKRLVVTGLYRWVRNPMYVGLALLLLGETLLFPQIALEMLIMIAIVATAVTLLVTRYEEPALRRQFGTDYDEYCRHVPRWVPRLTPFDKPRTAA